MRLDLSYDGTDFAGWARQPDRRTVQETVEQALARVLRAPTALTVAGRTDAGVHAEHQVAHADLPDALWESSAPSLLRRLAGVLPADVRVREVRAVPAAFDARFAALSRTYHYRIADTAWGVDPLRRRDTLAWPRPLDEAAMVAASVRLAGEHDFAAYCRRRAGATTVRRLLRLDWARAADVLVATVEADAFCHSMVRSLIGALLQVGDGRRERTWPAGVLAGRLRHPGGYVAPAHGLTLAGVAYPPDDQLAARVAETRRLRVP